MRCVLSRLESTKIVFGRSSLGQHTTLPLTPSAGERISLPILRWRLRRLNLSAAVGAPSHQILSMPLVLCHDSVGITKYQLPHKKEIAVIIRLWFRFWVEDSKVGDSQHSTTFRFNFFLCLRHQQVPEALSDWSGCPNVRPSDRPPVRIIWMNWHI